MKCVTKDGNNILRVSENYAEILVRNNGYRYIPKKEWVGCPFPDDPNHDSKIREIHTRSLKIAKEKIEKTKDKNSSSETKQET